MSTTKSPAEALRDQVRTNENANSLLSAGVAVGVIGAAGALIGAVCPICVVATPTLLGLGAVQKLRAVLAGHRLKSAN